MQDETRQIYSHKTAPSDTYSAAIETLLVRKDVTVVMTSYKFD